jgi:hypothetical protein
MSELLRTVASWPSLLLVIVVFGFAPGFCLRLLVLIYPRSDPRRTELIAELYTVPHIQRPLWVAEQLETALFEGLPHRLTTIFRWATHPHRARASVKLGPVLGPVLGLGLVAGLGAVLVAGLVAGLGAMVAGLGAVLVVVLMAGLGAVLGDVLEVIQDRRRRVRK